MFELSVVIPVLNEAQHIGNVLRSLGRHKAIQIVVVDGGSSDNTVEIIQSEFPYVTLLHGEKGRAVQMNAGAAIARADTLLFLHGDTKLPDSFFDLIENIFENSDKFWGRFDVRLANTSLWAKVISKMINWRSRTFGIATGDQAIFVKTKIFSELGGYPDQKLMEDVELSKRLKKAFGMPLCINECVETSSRRWEKNGVIKTVYLMWKLRFYYFIGVPVDRLNRMYHQ